MIRHFTASAIVFDDELAHVLLIHHKKIGKYLYPGGHVDDNQAPAEAAVREVEEETGVTATVITDQVFTHPAITTHAAPFTILEMPVVDPKIGAHRHIDLVYVLRAPHGKVTAQLDEVNAAQWVPLAEVTGLETPPELPSLIAVAARWAKARW